MPAGFKIADGYVEVHAKYDKADLRRAAQDAANDFDDGWDRERDKDVDDGDERKRGKRVADHLLWGVDKQLRQNAKDRISKPLSDSVDRDRAKHISLGKRIGQRIGIGVGDKKVVGNAASSFFRSFVEVISFGQADIGGAKPNSGIAKWASKAGVALGLTLAGALILKAAEMVTALSPILLGALAAIPISKMIGQKWIKPAREALTKEWKSLVEFIGRPLKLPLLNSLIEIKIGLQNLRVPVQQFMAAVGAAMQFFTRGAMQGVLNFFTALKPALGGITAGLRQWGIELPKIGKAFGDMFAKILSDEKLVRKAVQGFSGFLQGLMKLFGNLVVGLTYVSAAFGNFIRLIQIGFANSFLPRWLSGVTQAWGPLKQAILSAWDAFKKFATADSDAEIVSRFRTLMQRIKEIWGPLKTFLGQVFLLGWNLVKTIWNTHVVPWFNSTVMPWLKQKGRELIKVLVDEMITQAKEKFTGFIHAIPGMLSGLVGAILQPFVQSAQAAGKGARMIVERAASALRTLGTRARAAVSNLWSSMSGAFVSSAQRAGQAARNLVTNVANFLRALPGRARSAVSGLWGSMSGAFSSAISNARSAATRLVNGFITALRNIISRARGVANSAKSAIIGAFSGAGSWLVSAGRNIVNGLISGLQSRLGAVTALAQRIGAVIKANKGPERYDKIMLYDNGQFIMQGLMRGIDSQRRPLMSQLQGLTKAMPGSVAGPDAALAHASGTGQANGAAFSPTVNLYMQPGFYSENAAAKRALTKDVFLALEQYRKDYER